MASRPNRLLLPGADDAWARIAAAERPGASASVEDRLRRGQRLSAQAAALRRAVSRGARRSA